MIIAAEMFIYKYPGSGLIEARVRFYIFRCSYHRKAIYIVPVCRNAGRAFFRSALCDHIRLRFGIVTRLIFNWIIAILKYTSMPATMYFGFYVHIDESNKYHFPVLLSRKYCSYKCGLRHDVISTLWSRQTCPKSWIFLFIFACIFIRVIPFLLLYDDLTAPFYWYTHGKHTFYMSSFNNAY